jgi:hypothetical protein
MMMFSTQLSANQQIKIKGLVNDARTGLPISFAHIYIPQRNVGTASNMQGEFRFELLPFDSISISAIGYDAQVVYLTDSIFEKKIELNIKLIPKVYDLAEVQIRPFPTYQELKRKILDYEMTDEEIQMAELQKAFQKNMAMLAKGSSRLDGMDDAGGIRIGGPITAIYNLFSKHAKNQKKYYKLIKADKTKLAVAKRVNFEVVSRLTGLKDEEKVNEFIAYCSFSDDYILAATDIDLYKQISYLYDQYRGL